MDCGSSRSQVKSMESHGFSGKWSHVWFMVGAQIVVVERMDGWRDGWMEG